MKFTTSIIAFFAALAVAAPAAQRDNVPDVTGSYIVRVRNGATYTKHMEYVRALHKRSIEKRGNGRGGRRFRGVEREYGFQGWQGYRGHFDDDVVAELEADPDVDIEPDQVWTTYATQNNAPYGIAALSGGQAGSRTYTYDDKGGEGTFGYVVDTGMNTAHADFEGRASNGYNAVDGVAFRDTNGHGTHVGGTMGSKTYGVAKKANLIAVKVFDGGSGSTGVILEGFDWAVNDIVNKGRQGKAVINMSLGGGQSRVFNTAVTEAANRGVVTVVAAGNSNTDASTQSPASAPKAITVGSVDSRFRKSSFSNYGTVVDVHAPGTGILSTWIGSNTATNSISGTSMASPHVAGVVNYLQSVRGVTGADATSALIKELARKNAITGLPNGTPNALASIGGTPAN